MAIMGISGTDLKHAGLNFAIFAAAGGSCGLLAWGVYKLAFRIYSHVKPPHSFHQRDTAENYSRWVAFVVGAGTAWALHATISASRFAPINNPSLGKMFMIGAGQALIGAVADRRENSFPLFTAIGVSTAIAGHWSRYALVVFGLTGAAVGAVNGP